MATENANTQANDNSQGNRRKPTILDKLSTLSGISLLGGLASNASIDFRPDMSLVEVFARYMLPVVGAVGLGVCFNIGAKPGELPKTVDEMKEKLDIETAKTAAKAGLSALAVVSLVGGIQLWNYQDEVAKKAEEDRVAQLPEGDGSKVIETKTIVVETTLKQKACGLRNYGYVPYKYEGQEIKVNCGIPLMPTASASGPR